jgi:hypothetical protein
MGFHNLCWRYKPRQTKKQKKKSLNKAKIGSREEHKQLI